MSDLDKLIELSRRAGGSAAPARRAERPTQAKADESARLGRLPKAVAGAAKRNHPRKVRKGKKATYTSGGHRKGVAVAKGRRTRRGAVGGVGIELFALMVIGRNAGRQWVTSWLVSRMVQRKEARTELRRLASKGLVEIKEGPRIRLKRVLLYRLTAKGYALFRMLE